MRPHALVAAGLGAQVVGVSTQGLWHMLLAGGDVGLLSEDRTFLIDHTTSNLGVPGMTLGAWQLLRTRPGAPTRVLLVGTALEVLGAGADMLGHLGGGESRAAFALLGAGFVIATAGLLADLRKRRRELAQQHALGASDW